MASTIPIRNVYYLLCYAWNRLKEGAVVDVSQAGTNELADLFARVLLGGIRHLRRRGLEQGYEPMVAELAGVRGRIDIVATSRRFLDKHGRALCEFDELTFNTLPNQILKATLAVLIDVETLDGELRKDARRAIQEFRAVQDQPLRRDAFRRVHLHTNNRHYRFLLSVCELVMRACLPDEEGGHHKFRDFVRDDQLMPKVFEDFVFNFFRIERSDFDTGRDLIAWQATSENDPQLRFLPGMRTDISLRRPGRTVIIDTKYYRETFQQHYDRQSIHSSHLFQLFAYLKNLEPRGGADATAEGILLYPVVKDSVDLRYEMHGHHLRVRTVNLMQDWHQIYTELRSLV
jgi:5-methylcytosine-specific restriction enzyme subunit McrC